MTRIRKLLVMSSAAFGLLAFADTSAPARACATETCADYDGEETSWGCDDIYTSNYHVWVRASNHGYPQISFDLDFWAKGPVMKMWNKPQGLNWAWFNPKSWDAHPGPERGDMWYVDGDFKGYCACMFRFGSLRPASASENNFDGRLWVEHRNLDQYLDDPDQCGDGQCNGGPPSGGGGWGGDGGGLTGFDSTLGSETYQAGGGGNYKVMCWVTDWYLRLNDGPREFYYTEIHMCWLEEV